MPPECQTVWTKIRPDISSGLILVETVSKGRQQMTLAGKELITGIAFTVIYLGCNEQNKQQLLTHCLSLSILKWERIKISFTSTIS